ncbi:DUF4873 domain-containing protein [Haloechinothrix sp. YIM 98757]|uniref:DUF4873 domain-containing protein n=1 Tax=Haloechinothrix aidingensis TaxID=2752311 RepID=A0A838AFE1_9PSEU|nr:DUF4873 domain-containing protein [Haloechinothrix aidingensis]MBA0127973.1 DUF4873 domain-containing protein [Haloechinothrix aidingensis]
MSEHDQDEDGYVGQASLLVEDTTLTVDVQLRGHFQPIDGYYRWYGRIAANQELDQVAGGKKKKVTITTSEGAASGEISDPDPWNRYRISGTSTPPFAVPTSLADIEG